MKRPLITTRSVNACYYNVAFMTTPKTYRTLAWRGYVLHLRYEWMARVACWLTGGDFLNHGRCERQAL